MSGNLLLVALAGFVSASEVRVSPRSNRSGTGGSGLAGAAAQTGAGAAGAALNIGPAMLNGAMPVLAPAPELTLAPGGLPAAPGAGKNDGPRSAPRAANAAPSAAPRLAAAPAGAPSAAPAAPDSPSASLGAALEAQPGREAAQRAGAGPAAASALGGAARGVDAARIGATPASDGLAERAALDKTFDSMSPGRALSGSGGVSPNGVAGQFQTLRGRVSQTLETARIAPPANAPEHYAGLLDYLKDKLLPDAYKSVEKGVKSVAYAKADQALPQLAQEAYAAAARGDAVETKRLLKGFDAWQGLLGTPARPLISNGAMLQADIARRLEAARAGEGEPAPRRTLWFERRGDRYAAALPGSALERLSPALALGFALKPSALPAPGESLDAAWRSYAARPTVARGFREVLRGRRSRGASVPVAVAAAVGFSLRSLLHQAWLAVRSLFIAPAYALNTPSGIAALRRDLAAQGEVASAGAELRAALAAEAPTVGRLRAALEALQRQAAAHERLQGRLARSGAASLASAFEAAAAGLPDSEPLDDAMARLAFGPDGVLRQSQAMTQDAAASIDRRVFAGAGAGLRHSEGSRLWAFSARRGGAVTLSADLRGTSAGGYMDLRAPGDDALAARLAGLGFVTRLEGGVVTATLDADALDLSGDRMSPLAGRALAVAGAQ